MKKCLRIKKIPSQDPRLSLTDFRQGVEAGPDDRSGLNILSPRNKIQWSTIIHRIKLIICVKTNLIASQFMLSRSSE